MMNSKEPNQADSVGATHASPLSRPVVEATHASPQRYPPGGRQSIARRALVFIKLARHLSRQQALLQAACNYFIEAKGTQPSLSFAAEWLLDNFYMVEQAFRQVREDLPAGYFSRLPGLTAGGEAGAPLTDIPRVFGLTWEIIQTSQAYLEIERVNQAIHSYQQDTPLTIGELWAIPIMLRIGLLEKLAQSITQLTHLEAESSPFQPAMDRIAAGSATSPAPDPKQPQEQSHEVSVANCIRSLRMLATQDWMAFFENISQVEQELRHDPSGDYAHMDVKTRDRYRGAVEELAIHSHQAEIEVARAAIGLALPFNEANRDEANSEETNSGEAFQASHGGEKPGRLLHQPEILHKPGRAAHVGYYLIGEGRAQLEGLLGFRPSWLMRWQRWLYGHAQLAYLGSILTLTLGASLGLVLYLRLVGGTYAQCLVVALLAMVLFSSSAANLVNFAITHFLPPRLLPKLDFQDGLPNDCHTMVVIPALLGNPDEVNSLLRQIELHYLGNAMPGLYFALLTDFTDAPQAHMPNDEALLEIARSGIRRLNTQYSRGNSSPFYLFHRQRLYNQKEDCWMGWERKRGKLVEFNHLLTGAVGSGLPSTFTTRSGDLSLLGTIRYVITLDADTTLSKDSASRMIATLAHPLNRAELNQTNDTLIAGYTVLQPRLQVRPTSANSSVFSWIFAGDTIFDLYTRGVSDVYQDLFGESSYYGKGIYDVAAFEHSIDGKAPENALVSHDLFEGILGRVGLISDIILYEDYPPNCVTYMRRLHRWVRGDWQISPWLMPRVPYDGDGTLPNPLTLINRWKILDNLRRSLLAPGMLSLLIGGWLWLPGSNWIWLATALMPLYFSALTIGLSRLKNRLVGPASSHRDHYSLRIELLRILFFLIVLPYWALVMLSAILLALIRMVITHKNLLQWTAAAQSLRKLGAQLKFTPVFRQMWVGPVLGVGITAAVVFFKPSAMPFAAPFILAWLGSVWIAVWSSRPLLTKPAALAPDQLGKLHGLARRTWFFFEQFVGPEDHWLPPDHYQADPRSIVAHHTSPTNIGLLLLSTLSAYDLGYIGALELSYRLRDTLDGMQALERYRGHILNWHDTRSLKPLPPRYVSFVDSGNLAACLLALRQSCQEIPQAPLLQIARWQGLLDTLDLLTDTIQSAGLKDATLLLEYTSRMRQTIMAGREQPAGWPALLNNLCGESCSGLSQVLVSSLEKNALPLEEPVLNDLRIWTERAQQHLVNIQREMEMLLPWQLALQRAPVLFTQVNAGQPLPKGLSEAWQALRDGFPLQPALHQVEEICKAAEGRLMILQQELVLAASQDGEPENPSRLLHGAGPNDPFSPVQQALNWCEQLAKALTAARHTAEYMLINFQIIAAQAEAFFEGMDFSFLFNAQRQVFHIGYTLDSDRLDDNYYDLMASEARLGGLVAIGKGDAPLSHWLHLGRPMTHANGKSALLSWSGTMFEYLMPSLIMRAYPGSLIDQSCQAAVSRQITYGRQKDVPWGISESGYYHFDDQMNYQYQAFGVPGLGFKRGLSESLVVAPYASLLALSLRPQAVMENIERLSQLKMLGLYGFYEAIDFTPVWQNKGVEHAIVSSYMAHHQGMILLALNNYFTGDGIVRRFHADPRIQCIELLLQEELTPKIPAEFPHPEEMEKNDLAQVVLTALQPRPGLHSWEPAADSLAPQLHCLSNGSYSVLITNAGSGFSRWKDTQLTRWRADTTLDNWGTWIYIQDLESAQSWSAARQPLHAASGVKTVFSPHKVEFMRRDHDISCHTALVIAPEDDVEIRWVTLINHSDRPRHLALTSFAEVALSAQADDERHPAFNKLFVESEYISESKTLLFRRRPRSAQEKPLFMAHLVACKAEKQAAPSYETDRGRFLGRYRNCAAPAALDPRGAAGADYSDLSNTTGATFDPVLAIRQTVDLEAHATLQLAFITLAAPSRQKTLGLAARYQDWSTILQAFVQAEIFSARELTRNGLASHVLEHYQSLLSLLFYPHRALRCATSTLEANTKGQSGLWPYAISGDYPILLVRVEQEEGISLVNELLQAHSYWRNQQLKIDLVLLNLHDTGYDQSMHGQLQRLIAQSGGDAWLNRRGGIFLLRADPILAADLTLLETVARVVLNGGSGSLPEQCSRLNQQPIQLPQFVATLPERPENMHAPTTPPQGLLFDNGWGGFSPDGKEYMIYLQPGQPLPAPWINVIANPDFGFLVSETGLGSTWAANSGENRLTPWRNDPVSDLPGECLYLRDEETGQVWSPTPQPAPAPTPYLIRHGAGYSIFEHSSHALKQQLRVFAAPHEPLKIVQMSLENTGSRFRCVTITYFAEWVLGVNREACAPYVISEFDASCHALLARNPYNVEFSGRVAFLAATREPYGITADRSEFLGRLGSHQHPAALGRMGLATRVEAGQDPCAALQIILWLPPGEVKEVTFLLGQGSDRAESVRLIRSYQNINTVQAAWQQVNRDWSELLETVQVQTPDPAINLLFNRWLLYQTLACRMWGRSALYQPSGAFGFRDQLQDSLSLMLTAPEMTRRHLLEAASHQFKAGDVLHWWHPPSGRGVRTRCSDDLVWLVYVANAYIDSTGDVDVLKEMVPYLQDDPLADGEMERYGLFVTSPESGSLFDHCQRALEKSLSAGAHGLPLIMGGDWNDGLNRVGAQGRGESVWLGWFLLDNLNQFAQLCLRSGNHPLAARYQRKMEELRKAIEDNAWDGSWYRRGYYDDGTPLGSATQSECQIDSIAQSWAVLSGAGQPQRSARAMQSLAERLVRREEQLLLLLTPPFDLSDHDPGYIKGYLPGIRENGGQYTHAAIWATWAFARLGQGDLAGELAHMLNPIYHADTREKASIYRIEPYVLAGDVYSAPSHVGRGGWSWYTGSASWMYRLYLEAILGFKKVGNTLRIQPVLPANWQGFALSYHFGQSTFQIQVIQDAQRAGKALGAAQVELDGAALEDGVIPLLDDGRDHEVVVRV